MDFNVDVIEYSKKSLVVVDFYADWCGPCKVLGPLLEKLSEEMKFKLVKINTEQEQELASHFSVMSIPTVFFFKDGEPIDMFVGAYPENAIKEMVNKYL